MPDRSAQTRSLDGDQLVASTTRVTRVRCVGLVAAGLLRNASDGDGDGWGVDWPRADENLSIRLSELTRTRVSLDETGTPKHLLMRLTDAVLSHCPFAMMTEP